MRIAMWSGPRNISTAMMYSFAARGDCGVWDEPFYAAYLATSGLDHPMRDDIIHAHESNPSIVAKRCSEPDQDNRPHFYMKHMPHHMLDGFPMDWAKDCVNVHLIRHPARVIASYAAKRTDVTMDDIGFVQQSRIFEAYGGIVLDSFDVRQNPRAMLQRLCTTIGLPYLEHMLSWPSGGHPSDGVWAAHWYGAVHQSTGFAGPEGPLPQLDTVQSALAAQAMPFYDSMAREKL